MARRTATVVRDLRWYLVVFLRCAAGFMAVTGLIAAAIPVAGYVLDDEMLEGADLIAVMAFVVMAAVLWWLAALLKRRSQPLDLLDVAAWVFGGMGGLMILGGIAGAFDDPAALLMIPFGGVFVGVGYLVRKLFAAPPGRKYVPASAFAAYNRSSDGSGGRHVVQTMILVDADASKSEIAAERLRWAVDQFRRRADWVAGEVHSEMARSSALRWWGSLLWWLVTAGFVLLAWYVDPFLWWMAVFLALGAVLWLVFAVRGELHDRRFGQGVLVLEQSPLYLGGQLRAELRSGVPQRLQQQARSRFRLSLRCVHRWEEKGGTGDRRTRSRSEELWSSEFETHGVPYGGGPIRQAARVVFDIPANLPECSLGSGRHGIFWELLAHLPLPGMDYRDSFRLPVVHPESLPVEAVTQSSPRSG